MLPRIVLCLCVSLLVSAKAVEPATEHLTLVTVDGSADTVAGEVVIVEAYERLGITVTVKRYPGERAIRLADHGEVDGEVQRIDAVKDAYPHLRQVRPAVNYLEASVFTTNAEFEVEDWSSLAPYRVGIIRGIKFAENNTVGMDRHLVGDDESLFTMLDRGRIEVAVVPRINGLFNVRAAGIDAIDELGSPIARFDLYHYLHEKHADLVPRIAAVLDEMARDGEIAAIRSHVHRVLLDRASRGLPLCDTPIDCGALYAWDPESRGE